MNQVVCIVKGLRKGSVFMRYYIFLDINGTVIPGKSFATNEEAVRAVNNLRQQAIINKFPDHYFALSEHQAKQLKYINN